MEDDDVGADTHTHLDAVLIGPKGGLDLLILLLAVNPPELLRHLPGVLRFWQLAPFPNSHLAGSIACVDGLLSRLERHTGVLGLRRQVHSLSPGELCSPLLGLPWNDKVHNAPASSPNDVHVHPCGASGHLHTAHIPLATRGALHSLQSAPHLHPGVLEDASKARETNRDTLHKGGPAVLGLEAAGHRGGVDIGLPSAGVHRKPDGHHPPAVHFRSHVRATDAYICDACGGRLCDGGRPRRGGQAAAADAAAAAAAAAA
mmetsp:Transcript_55338/g.121410  ORF Transcript_55338/g.121410 Transcript_55338/m.121410 type:complete len:259 (-) Transcript_55338:197-973(-)